MTPDQDHGPQSRAQDRGQDPAGTGLVIFDFDGVVVDSEPISLATLHSALSDYGVKLTLDDVRAQFLGASIRQVEQFLDRHGTRPSADGFASHWYETLFTRFRQELRPMPGIDGLLDHLDRCGLPYCIASGSSFERLDVALGAVGMTERFTSRVFSADLVQRGKPAPDLFLRAAAGMAVPPSRCLVIEDSPAGITGAKSAGMRALGFVGGSHLVGFRAAHGDLLRENRADDVIDELSDAKRLL